MAERTDKDISMGLVCSGIRCNVQFDGIHGEPVLCVKCHNQAIMPTLPKAWMEEATPK